MQSSFLPIMSVLRFRTVWGVNPGKDYVHWAKWFPDLKAQGYSRLVRK